MGKKYIISLDTSTKEQDTQFIEFLKTKPWKWWHYISNTWLIVDPTGQSNAAEIRDKLLLLYDGVYTLVVEIKEKPNWAGFGPNSETKNMFTWIKENLDN